MVKERNNKKGKFMNFDSKGFIFRSGPAKKETQNIINLAKTNVEKNILEKTEKFHQLIEDRKKNIEQKITQMKENALKDIKNSSIKISMETVEHLIKNSIDKSKLEKVYIKSLEQAKIAIKHIKP